MRVKDIITDLEKLSPLAYAEDFDNVGLLVGNKESDVSGVLITLDTLESVVEEALKKNCNMIVSFHPIIFGGLKKLTGNSYVERVVIKAIQHNIAIYSMHTALDNCFQGVNAKICEMLNLQNQSILIPKKHTLRKLITYAPKNEASFIRDELFKAGAGNIGNYSECSFSIKGKGTFKAGEDSCPTLGEKGKRHYQKESRIEVIYPKHIEKKLLNHLFSVHSYEEVAYDIYSLENDYQEIGMGMIGELEKPMENREFLSYVKEKMQTSCIRHSECIDRPIKKVAVLGGSGAFAIEAALRGGADAFISADFKYHDFFKAEKSILLADIGHYESEQFTKNLLYEYLTKKIPNFAVILSELNTNPIKYL